MQRLLNVLLLANLFLTPLIPAEFGFGYELIKVLTFLSLTIVAGLIFVYLLSKKKLKIHSTKIKISALLFFLILSMTSLLGIHPLESLAGKYPYFEGLILYWFLFLFYLILSESKLSLKSINQSISFSAAIVAIVAIFQFILINAFKIDIPSYSGRVVSTFGQPNLYSGFLLLSLPFAFQLKSYKYLLIGIISLGVVVSLSKAAIILLLALGLVVLYKNTKYKGLFAFGILVIFLNALVFSLNQSSGLVWDEVLKPLSQTGVENYQVERRIYIIPVLLEEYSRSPLMGFGIDSINSLYKGHFAGFKPELKNYPPLYFNLMNLNIDRSHNYFLDLLIFSGILGLAGYVCLIYFVFKKPAPSYMKVVLLLYLIWVQFQVQSIVQMIIFWLVLGIVDKKATVDTNKKLKDY